MNKLLLLFFRMRKKILVSDQPHAPIHPFCNILACHPSQGRRKPECCPTPCEIAPPLSFKTMIGVVILNLLKNDRSVSRLNCWSSSAQSVLVSAPIGTHGHIFVLSTISRVSKWGFLFDGSVWLLLVTPRLLGVTRVATHSLTGPLLQSHIHSISLHSFGLTALKDWIYSR
jgi:hypothetical protein